MGDEDERAEGERSGLDVRAAEEELVAAASLGRALERSQHLEGDDAIALVQALRAAWSGAAIEPDVHEALVEAAVASSEEEARALARMLEHAPTEAGTSAEADLVHALRAAARPSAIEIATNDRLVAAALLSSRGPARERDEGARVAARVRRDAGGARLRRAIGGAAGGLLLAAVLVLVLSRSGAGTGPALARSRTTQPLFTEPFRAAETTARVDRIALARASDLRKNRFAARGIR